MSNSKRIIILDSLRGIAALIVVFHHLFVLNRMAWVNALEGYPWLLNAVQWLSNRNHEAVLFFFLLSGFVIYLSTHKLDFRKKEDINYYLFRRFRRILPLYWLTLLFTFILGYFSYAWQDHSFSISTLVGNIFFLQTSDKVPEYWFAPYGVNGPLWSLAYEMFFYLFFPLYWRFTRWLGAKLGGFRGITSFEIGLISSLVIAIIAIGLRSIWFMPYFSFLALFIIWYSGFYLAYLYKTQQTADPLITWITLFMVILQVVGPKAGSDTLGVIAKAWMLFLPSYLYYRTYEWTAPKLFKLKRFLNRLFLKVGEGSYAIYLLHYPFLALLSLKVQWHGGLELLLIIVWCWLVSKLEVWLNQQALTFFKRKYV